MLLASLQDPFGPAGSFTGVGNVGNIEHLHPVGLAALGVLSVMVLTLHRRHVLLPLVLQMCLVPDGQRLVLFTLDFPFLRVLLLLAWLRLLVRQELRPLEWNLLDKLLVVWAILIIPTGVALWGDFSVAVNRGGFAFDALANYMLVRQAVRGPRDLVAVIGKLLFCTLVAVPFFVNERLTGHNMFSHLGGVPEITDIREGRLRCQGAFSHPILAGCFVASLIPLFVLRGLLRRDWLLCSTGIVSALVIVWLCSSSTPVMAVLFGTLGLMIFRWRHLMPLLRWLILLGLVAFSFHRPVWWLFARVNVIGGSTGWHRYYLMDEFVNHYGEWFLVGTRSTAHWGIGLADVTNHYILEAVRGGFFRLAAFLAIILTGFVAVSRTLRHPNATLVGRRIAWVLGTLLFVHCMNFLAVSYFGQITALWYLTLGLIGSLLVVPGSQPIVGHIVMRTAPSTAAVAPGVI